MRKPEPAERFKREKDTLRPTLRAFFGWLTLYAVAIFLSASFDFSLVSAQHGGSKAPLVSLISLVWAAVGWVPMAIILARALPR